VSLSVIGESEFDELVLHSPVPVLVDFFTEWCVPCKQLAPTLEELAEVYGESFRIVSVDAEASPELAKRYDITGYPTMVLVKDGTEIARPRSRTRLQLRTELDEALGAGSATSKTASDVEVPDMLRPVLDQLLALDGDAWSTIDARVREALAEPAGDEPAARVVDEAALTDASTRLQNDVEELAATRLGDLPLAGSIASAAAASFDRWVRQSPVRPGWAGAFRYVPSVRMSPYLPDGDAPDDLGEAADSFVARLAGLDAGTWDAIRLVNQDFWTWADHSARVGQGAWFAAVVLLQATVSAELIPAQVHDACWAPFEGLLDREGIAA